MRSGPGAAALIPRCLAGLRLPAQGPAPWFPLPGPSQKEVMFLQSRGEAPEGPGAAQTLGLGMGGPGSSPFQE